MSSKFGIVTGKCPDNDHSIQSDHAHTLYVATEVSCAFLCEFTYSE